jgi:hypothetical protein
MRAISIVGAILLCCTLLTPNAAAEPVKFGGMEIEGKSIAFVCDGSRWTKNKLKELIDELAGTVESMTPDQQFAVIFFADDKTSGPNDGRPLPATEDNKRRLRDWLRGIQLGDKPTPIPGLTRAFEGKPDTVVFITDGEFDDYNGVAEHVATLNAKRGVRVHAVGFFATEDEDDSRSFVRFMKSLAERNGGRFKAVYADELKRVR